MATTTTPELRELDQRASDGLTVTLWYHPDSPDEVKVSIADDRSDDEPRWITAPADRATWTFNHALTLT